MIETIRKHSKWLLWIIAGATIASLVIFMGSGPVRNAGAGGVSTNLVRGEIYGEKVTVDRYVQMQKDVDLDYLFNAGQWPSQNPNITQDQLLGQIYLHMMMVQKAKQLGVHVSPEQVAQATAKALSSPGLLRALNVSGQTVPIDSFVKQVLTPQGLTAADFENYIRDQIAIEQLQQLYSLSGEMITPQEAAAEYVRQNQELSAQIVFFPASNYVEQVTVPPQAVGQFYTNYMADYRLPDRVQVSYVLFSVTNYLAAAETTLMKTNFAEQVNYFYNKYGMQVAPDAKTPDEAKAQIRKTLIRQQALGDAEKDANAFAQAVFNVSTGANKPASAGDLTTTARQKGLSVQTPEPFSAQYGPQEFEAPAVFVRTSFELSSDSPISEPVMGPAGVYVIALDQQLPSGIPPLSEIRGQVTRDYILRVASLQAIQAGTNFVRSLNVQMAMGKSFAAASIAAGAQPHELPPFAMSTQEIPELGNFVKINQLKQVAFSIPMGIPSGFVQTDEGGFVLYVQSQLPIDQAKMTADLPDFTAQLREQRANAAYHSWYLHEVNRELRSTPMAKEMGPAQ